MIIAEMADQYKEQFNRKNIAQAQKLCDKFGVKFNVENTEMQSQQKVNATKYFVGKFCKARTHPDYKPINQIEEILEGQKDLLVYCCSHLYEFNSKMIAKGIYIRNGLTINDFN